MKRINVTLVVSVFLLCLNSNAFTQDGLILPMPGQNLKQTNTETQKTSQPTLKTTKTKYSNDKKSSDNSEIIPMPNLNKNKQQEVKSKQKKSVTINQPKSNNSVDINNEPLIAIPTMNNTQKVKSVAPTPAPLPKSDVSATTKPADNNPTTVADEAFLSDFTNDIDDFPSLDNQEMSSTDESKVENILPPAEADISVAQNSSGEKITIYPKDSGSAIFMVMKSWQCDDYDVVSLINQALEVYGKDSAETYQINGLENIAKGTTVSVEEEDITFDELLDILGSKTGNDWGCDIANKTIYIYPKGIKTESYVSWE